MNTVNRGQVIGIPVDSSDYEQAISSNDQYKDSDVHEMNKFSNERNISFARSFHEHVTMGSKLSETVKGKIILGKRLLRAGSVEKLFRQSFSNVQKSERLLKASQCYLSTTSGPIAGILFISDKNIAFRSDKSLTLTCLSKGSRGVPYKVLIPLNKVQKAVPSENLNKPEQRYLEIVTVDEFEFWFMGFVNYQSSFNHLKQALLLES